ncbi:hypothetical protein FF1_023868 [Malus domestica]
MEPHCAAQDALLKVHDRIVEEDRFGGVTFDDDNENSVVTTRLLVPNNMNPRKDKPPSGFPMPFLSPRNPMLFNRAPSHTMSPMPWTGGYENRSGFVRGGFNGFPPGHGAGKFGGVIGKGGYWKQEPVFMLRMHQRIQKKVSQTIETILELQNRRSEFSDRGIITTRLLVLGCLLGQGEFIVN